MHVTAHLDLDVIPLDQDGEVTVLIEITAPESDRSTARPPATLQVVLDRSGSMNGDKLAGAQRALLALADRLDPADNFGLVSFDHTARVEIPAGPLTDKTSAKQRIGALHTGGQTDLSSGLLRGVQEARRSSADRGATLLLISDGHANVGIVDHARLGQIAKAAHQHGITTTTLGYGMHYDEALMTAIADAGAGSALHAKDPDAAGQLIADEVDCLLAKVSQAASLTIAPHDAVSSMVLYGDLPTSQLSGGALMTELGDFYAGESRKVLLRLIVRGGSTSGLATIAELAFTYVEVETLTTYTVTVPITVNAIPGDQAAGLVPNVTVRAELLFQEAQSAKRHASDALLHGDTAKAQEILNAAGDELEKGMSWAPNVDELAAEVKEIRRYAREASTDHNRISKEARASWYLSTRKRGRPTSDPDDPSDQK